MFITITDASKGKPFALEESIKCSRKKIGIHSISVWVGWYNIDKPQTCQWKESNGDPTDFTVDEGLYSFKDLSQVLAAKVNDLIIEVNSLNGIMTMTIPPSIELLMTNSMLNLLGIEESGWLSGIYEGDRAVELSPRNILIFLKQLSSSGNLFNNNQRIVSSELLGSIPVSDKRFGENYTVEYSKIRFKDIQEGTIHNLDFDFKVEWANGTRKLNNHSQPISLELEIIDG